MSPRVVAPLLVLVAAACRPHHASPPTSAGSLPTAAREEPALPPIPVGSGVVVRPGATVWLDADGARPIVLPERLAVGGIALTVLADRGAKLEVETATTSACASPLIGAFALHLFIARSDLRPVTTSAIEYTAGELQLRVARGAPVDGPVGAHWIAVTPDDAPIRIAVADAQLADHVPPPLETGPCAGLTAFGETVGIDVGDADLATAHVDAAREYSGPFSTVRRGAKVWWRDGTAAGTVARKHTFLAQGVAAGARSCLPLLLARDNTTTLCFESADVNSGTAIAGSAALSDADVFGSPAGDRPVMQVRQANATVKGALDRDILRRIVRAHINELRGCYGQALVEDPTTTGRVVVTFTIDKTGAVTKSEATESSVPNEKLTRCMAKAVERWKFPKPEDGRKVVVAYPFLLETGG